MVGSVEDLRGLEFDLDSILKKITLGFQWFLEIRGQVYLADFDCAVVKKYGP